MLLFDNQTRVGPGVSIYSRSIYTGYGPKTVKCSGAFGGATCKLVLTTSDKSEMLPLDDAIFVSQGASVFTVGGHIMGVISGASATTQLTLEIS